MTEGIGQNVVIDLPSIVDSIPDKWYNATLSQVNESLVRFGIFEGEFHWHKHDLEDEFFFVVSGTLLLDVEDKTYTLIPQQGFTVPKGVQHRTRAEEKTVVLMIETDTVKPKGD